MKIVIHPSVWHDIADGFHFYNAQARGVGDRFRESLISDIETLKTTAGIHRKVFGLNRMLAQTFPFAVFYSCDGEVVLVRAVVDCRRNPLWIRKRLG